MLERGADDKGWQGSICRELEQASQAGGELAQW